MSEISKDKLEFLKSLTDWCKERGIRYDTTLGNAEFYFVIRGINIRVGNIRKDTNIQFRNKNGRDRRFEIEVTSVGENIYNDVKIYYKKFQQLINDVIRSQDYMPLFEYVNADNFVCFRGHHTRDLIKYNILELKAVLADNQDKQEEFLDHIFKFRLRRWFNSDMEYKVKYEGDTKIDLGSLLRRTNLSNKRSKSEEENAVPLG
jgi:hypothetical protein